MKDFLQKVTFARAMIVLCLLASAVLGYLIVQNQARLNEQAEDLAPDGAVVRQVREIQSLAKQYTELYDSKDSEGLRGMTNPQSYISRIAGDNLVKIGLVDIKVSEREVTENIKDLIYTVDPKVKDDTFSLSQIGNFFYKLEDDSRRVRITDLTIEALNDKGQNRIQPNEYPTGSWDFSVKVTSRQRSGGG